jgi:hypothetical protein
MRMRVRARLRRRTFARRRPDELWPVLLVATLGLSVNAVFILAQFDLGALFLWLG